MDKLRFITTKFSTISPKGQKVNRPLVSGLFFAHVGVEE